MLLAFTLRAPPPPAAAPLEPDFAPLAVEPDRTARGWDPNRCEILLLPPLPPAAAAADDDGGDGKDAVRANNDPETVAAPRRAMPGESINDAPTMGVAGAAAAICSAGLWLWLRLMPLPTLLPLPPCSPGDNGVPGVGAPAAVASRLHPSPSVFNAALVSSGVLQARTQQATVPFAFL